MTDATLPALLPAQRITDGWTVLPSWLPVEGMGGLPVNAFLLKGREPMLVDTGLGALGSDLIEALSAEVDLDDLRWVWMSHTDADHIGNLAAVLDRAPNAQVLTNFLGAGKLRMLGHDLDRVRMLAPGEVFEVGGRRLHQVRPPYYDAPETVGFFDPAERVFFAADAFGALLPAPASELGEVPAEALRDGLVGWSSIDAPWLAGTDRATLGSMLAALERIDPGFVLSGHLPLARGLRGLTGIVAGAYAQGRMGGIDPLAIETVAAALG